MSGEPTGLLIVTSHNQMVLPVPEARSLPFGLKATVGTVYLFKRTALYAYLVAPGKPSKKISVPAGTDTIRFAQGS